MLPQAPLSVLLVDDRPGNVLALEAALAGVDCNLVRAHSGRDARVALAVENARLHGGKITVAFPADSGSLFTVRLPR